MPYAAQLALIALLYFAAARLSLALAIPPGYATAVWPPSGIALAAALIFGSRVWPGIWLGAALANVMVESSFVAAALIATGNALEALVGAALIARRVGDPGRFERGEDVVKFIVLCALSATLAATVAAVTLASGHALPWDEAWRGWWTWWQGDTAGMILVAPLILSWRAGDRGAVFAEWPRPKKAEAAAFALLLAAAVAALAADQRSAFAPFSLTFVSLPFILWAAFRFGQREVTSAIAVVCAVAVWYVIERRELFAVAQNELLLMLLSFISMVVTTGLVLVTALSQRSRAADELRRKQLGLESQVHQYTYYDPLTGLPNSAMFGERLARLLETAGQRGAAVAVVDIDRFKTINDALGRGAGDELLRQIAARLSTDAAGIAARINGVQFSLATLVPEGAASAASMAEESLTRWFDAPFRVREEDLRLTARIGVALYPEHGTEPDALLARAESALKRAKATGERYLFYSPTMSERVAEKLLLENRLRRALERDEFVLYYQPKVDLETRQIAGLEALIRWRSPDLGVVLPRHFIPLLEESGLILEVGSWVLRRAMLDQASWRAAGVRVPRVAVNVSSIQLRQRDFVESVQAAIGDGEAAIDLEITESRIMEDIEANIAKLARLSSLGIGIAIDDFGTGYSSLAYLAKLPVQVLKIDRVFIVRMLEDEDAMALVQTILSLARTLKLTVVAEGVETDVQADVLATLRCDQMQGYLFSEPLPPEEIASLLAVHPRPPNS